MAIVLESAATVSAHRARPSCVRLSIVIPVYRGERSIGPLVRALVDCLSPDCNLEVVLVNDGSPDNSAQECRKLARAFSRGQKDYRHRRLSMTTTPNSAR